RPAGRRGRPGDRRPRGRHHALRGLGHALLAGVAVPGYDPVGALLDLLRAFGVHAPAFHLSTSLVLLAATILLPILAAIGILEWVTWCLTFRMLRERTTLVPMSPSSWSPSVETNLMPNQLL